MPFVPRTVTHLWVDFEILDVIGLVNFAFLNWLHPRAQDKLTHWGALHKIGCFRNVPTVGTFINELKLNLLTNVPTVGTFRKRPILCNAPLHTQIITEPVTIPSNLTYEGERGRDWESIIEGTRPVTALHCSTRWHDMQCCQNIPLSSSFIHVECRPGIRYSRYRTEDQCNAMFVWENQG